MSTTYHFVDDKPEAAPLTGATFVIVVGYPRNPLAEQYLQGPSTPQEVKRRGYGFSRDLAEAWPFVTLKAAQAKARILARHMSWAPEELMIEGRTPETAEPGTKNQEPGTLSIDDQCPQCLKHEAECPCTDSWRPVVNGVSLWPVAVVLASLLLSGCTVDTLPPMHPLLKLLLAVCGLGVVVTAWLHRATRRTEPLTSSTTTDHALVIAALKRSLGKRLKERRSVDLREDEEPVFTEGRIEGRWPLRYPTTMPEPLQRDLEALRKRLRPYAPTERPTSNIERSTSKN